MTANTGTLTIVDHTGAVHVFDASRFYVRFEASDDLIEIWKRKSGTEIQDELLAVFSAPPAVEWRP